MPLYEYQCDGCRTAFSATLPMAEAQRAVPCPTCGRLTHKNVVSSGVMGHVFRAYESVTYGIPPHAAARAERDNKGNLWYRDPTTGEQTMLNMPGEYINRRGNIEVKNSGERARMMKLRGAIELNDFASLSEEHKRRQSAAKAKLANAIERNRKGRAAAARAGSKIGWINE